MVFGRVDHAGLTRVRSVPLARLEHAAGQFAVSVAAEGPVEAADTTMPVRHTVRAVSARHGPRVSFAPVLTGFRGLLLHPLCAPLGPTGAKADARAPVRHLRADPQLCTPAPPRATARHAEPPERRQCEPHGLDGQVPPDPVQELPDAGITHGGALRAGEPGEAVVADRGRTTAGPAGGQPGTAGPVDRCVPLVPAR